MLVWRLSSSVWNTRGVKFVANSGPLKCKGCKKYFPRDSLILVPGGKFHDRECMISWAIENQDKGRKKINRAEKKKDLIRKNVFRGSDTKWQHTQTQKAFNKLRKLQEIKWFRDRGLEPECISCGKKNMDWCNGHFKTVGSQGALRYNPTNSYLQCNRYCNMGLSGNINGNKSTRGYLQGLEDRFGKEKSLEIINYCAKDRVKDWSCDELVKIRRKFNSDIRKLEVI